ncbi:MAG TPA: tRNA (adenosine(37)-N6)-threonylcarbamoyltransferase complex ATPase subunit type 1 TsaE, partial [Planctomycetes bacterium]|nr:tRNA (adenosine(37)-N6)-threonylcarbamoyltransferase complex ATPase subunit type 1 TsaE [Planctomycetota bacterium]
MSMGNERVLLSAEVAATEALGEALGRGLDAGDVVALRGDLGTGKTALTRGIARGLGVTEPVQSPTFALLHEYPGRTTLYHFDAWMSGREVGFLESGGAQLLGGDGVCVVEWAERIAPYLPDARLEVVLAHLGPTRRSLRFTVLGAGERAERLAGLVA